MTGFYDQWLDGVRSVLQSINMPFEDWQNVVLRFEREFRAGTEPSKAAEKANRYWSYEQNKALHQQCRRTAQCWLPQNQQGKCQPREDILGQISKGRSCED